MNVAEIFIRRPVMTTLVMLGILMFGIMGYRLLPVSDLPNVDFPTILVSASLPGATPDTMASAVAMPLEKQFSTIAGVDSMTSSTNWAGQVVQEATHNPLGVWDRSRFAAKYGKVPQLDVREDRYWSTKPTALRRSFCAATCYRRTWRDVTTIRAGAGTAHGRCHRRTPRHRPLAGPGRGSGPAPAPDRAPCPTCGRSCG